MGEFNEAIFNAENEPIFAHFFGNFLANMASAHDAQRPDDVICTQNTINIE